MSYIGSSKNIKQRMKDHKSACYNENKKSYNYFIYQYIRQHGGWDVFKKDIIYECDVVDEIEQKKVEQEWIKNNECKLNMRDSYLTDDDRKEKLKQWGEKNKEKLKEQKKQYYQVKLKEQKKQKVNCPNCNKEMNKGSLNKHLKNSCKNKIK